MSSESRVGCWKTVCGFEFACCGNASDGGVVCKQMSVFSVSVYCGNGNSCFACLMFVCKGVFGFCVLCGR